MTATLPGSGMDAWRSQSRKQSYAASVPAPPGGNSPWARAYGLQIKQLIERHAARAPRSLQVHLGPSELGIRCHRRVVGRMTAEPRTNHVSHIWPALIGTAVHAELAQALQNENARIGKQRFLTELRVAPVPDHAGSTDAFDYYDGTLLDWKVLGPTSMAKVASADGPSYQYKVQLLLYWLGALVAGLPVRRIALIALPRTAANLDGLYVWGHEPGPEDAELVAEVLRVTALRQQMAREILARRLTINDIPVTPGDECFLCPLFRPQAARDLGPGCPGTSIGQGSL